MQQTQQQKTLREYQAFFSQVSQEVQKFKKDQISLQVLKQHQISLIVNKDNELASKLPKFGDAYFEIQGFKSNGLTVLYQVVLGDFLLNIKVLNLNQSVGNIQDNIYQQGGFGVILKVQSGKRKMAIKRINFQKINTPNKIRVNSNDYGEQNDIKKVIREYCVYKICSLLNIGPAVLYENNYDLVCYNDCIEFVMELCQPPHENLSNVQFEIIQQNLKFNVYLLHQYGFIHRDIKPANILYSNTKRKFVLGDFGLTHTVAENVGEKSQTVFSGTDSYLSKQMKQLFSVENKKGFVDLFLNDLEGLKKTIKEFQDIKKIPNKKFSINQMSYQGSDEYQNCYEFQNQQYDSIDNNSSQSPILIDNPQMGPQIIQSYHSSKQSSNPIDLSYALEPSIQEIQTKYICQINLYISEIVYQIIFITFDHSQASIQKLIQEICQKQVHNNLKEFIKIRIQRIFYNKKQRPLNTENDINQYIADKQAVNLDKIKRKLQFLVRHYTVSVEILDTLNQIAVLPLNKLQGQWFKKCKMYFEAKISKKKNQDKNIAKTRLVLRNFKQTLISFQVKYRNNQQQFQSEELLLKYLLFLNYGSIKHSYSKFIYQNLISWRIRSFSSFQNITSLTQESYLTIRTLLKEQSKTIFNRNFELIKSKPQQMLLKDSRFFDVLANLYFLSEQRFLASCLIKVEELIYSPIWSSMHQIYKLIILKMLIYYKALFKSKIHSSDSAITQSIMQYLPQKFILSKENFLYLLKQYEQNYQQKSQLKCLYFERIFVYKNVVQFLLIDFEFELAKIYLDKVRNLFTHLILPNRKIVDNIELLILQFSFYFNQKKWKQAKEAILEAEMIIKKAPEDGFSWKIKYFCFNNLARMYSQEGNLQEACKNLKHCINLVIINQPFSYERIIYLTDNLIYKLLKDAKFSEVIIYSQMSIKAKCNLAKQKIQTNKLNCQQFNKVGGILINKCKKILQHDPEKLLEIIELYISLMKPNLWLFKSEYMYYCKVASQHHYENQNYYKFMKYISMYLQLVPIGSETEQDPYLIEACINSLIANKKYYKALVRLKKYTLHFTEQKQIQKNCYKQLYEVSQYLGLMKTQIYKFMHKRKFYQSRDHQQMDHYFQKKFANHQKNQLRLKIVEKVFKSL